MSIARTNTLFEGIALLDEKECNEHYQKVEAIVNHIISACSYSTQVRHETKEYITALANIACKLLIDKKTNFVKEETSDEKLNAPLDKIHHEWRLLQLRLYCVMTPVKKAELQKISLLCAINSYVKEMHYQIMNELDKKMDASQKEACLALNDLVLSCDYAWTKSTLESFLDTQKAHFLTQAWTNTAALIDRYGLFKLLPQTNANPEPVARLKLNQAV